MSGEINGYNLSESINENIVIWRSTFIRTGTTLAVIAFAIAFFLQNQFCLIVSGLAVAIGVLGTLNQRDLQSVNQFEKDLILGIQNTKSCAENLKKVERSHKHFIQSNFSLYKLIVNHIPKALEKALKTIETVPSLKPRSKKNGAVAKSLTLAKITEHNHEKVKKIIQKVQEQAETIKTLQSRINALESSCMERSRRK